MPQAPHKLKQLIHKFNVDSWMPMNANPQSIVVSTTPKYAINNPKTSKITIPRLQLLQYALNIQEKLQIAMM